MAASIERRSVAMAPAPGTCKLCHTVEQQVTQARARRRRQLALPSLRPDVGRRAHAGRGQPFADETGVGSVSVRRGSRVSPRRESAFNAQAFLDSALVAKSVTSYARGESIFAQGDASQHVMYIQSGGVKLSVVSKTRQGSGRRHARPGRLFRRGLSRRAEVPHGQRYCR